MDSMKSWMIFLFFGEAQVHRILKRFHKGRAMDENKISIYHHPNPEMKSFLTQEDISALRVEHFKNALENIPDSSLKALGPIGARIVTEILAISGIREIRIKPKEVLVKKERTADWKGIIPAVVRILERSLRRKRMKIVKRV